MNNSKKYLFGLAAFLFLIGAANIGTVRAASLGVGVDANASASLNAQPSATEDTNLYGNTGISTSQQPDLINISVDGNQARAMDDTSLSVSSPAQVNSDTDLQTYAEVVAHNDASVNAISTSQNSVAITFKRPAKLFGFIPVNVKEQANVSVDAQGNESVSVNKSWWSFLATTNLQSSQLSSAIQSALNAQGTLSAGASLSAPAKAQIISDIQASSDATYSNSN